MRSLLVILFSLGTLSSKLQKSHFLSYHCLKEIRILQIKLKCYEYWEILPRNFQVFWFVFNESSI